MTVGTSGPVRVVGAGLLGTSVGLALTRLGLDVRLADPSPIALALACEVGAGTASGPGDPDPALVVVAVPPDVAAEVVVRELADHPNAVVTDVASVKAHIVEAVAASGADLARYVGSHPMAGRERSGPSAGLPDLFLGRPWVLVDPGEASDRALLAVRTLAVDLGAVPVQMAAADHDRAVALVSHVPQVVASVVAARLTDAPSAALGLAGQGLRDMTRIAGSDPGLWTAILAANAEAVAEVLRDVRDDLDRVLGALETPLALSTIAGAIAQGNAGHGRVPGKHGGHQRSYTVLNVLVPDSPGSLARLLTQIGEIGVNLEDLAIEHAAGRPVGIANVSVLPEQADRLESELTAREWKVVR